MITSYISYWFKKLDQYSLQSPTLYTLYQELIDFSQTTVSNDEHLEEIRKNLLNDHTLLAIEDFGAGSRKLKKNNRTVAQVTKYSSSKKKYNKLYQYFCQKTPASTVLELGTCTGLNTQYLAQATKGMVHSIEGSKSLWELASKYNKSPNITFHFGEISRTLPEFLKTIRKLDFVLIDATHTEEATISYFKTILPFIHQKSIVTIADIHWSSGMEKAWKAVQSHPNVRLSIDFFECGILIFDPSFPEDDLILDY